MAARFFAIVFLLSGVLARAGAQEGESEEFDYLAEEARLVTTAGSRPTAQHRAPATTHVLSGEELRISGAATIYEALRRVPGVDVIEARSYHGAVGIRGLNKLSNNRLLIMVDGRSVLTGYFDTLIWETLPVTPAEVERIEIVAGPASALFGGNAISGVINIITKQPAQIDGARASYSYGERRLHMGSALVGRTVGNFAYKLSAGAKTGGSFADESRPSLRSVLTAGLLEWRPAQGTRLAASAGVTAHDVRTGASAFDDGQTGYVRLDAERGLSLARLFWNAGRSRLRENVALGEPSLDYDTYDARVEHGLAFERADVTFAGGWRRNEARSSIFPRAVEQDLLHVAAEGQWRPRESVSLVAGGRVDRHPLAGLYFAPRASALWFRSVDETWRLSAADGFRYPTLVENYIDIVQPVPGGTQRALGTDVRPERIHTVELSMRRSFERARLGASVFRYWFKNVIAGSAPRLIDPGPPQVFEITAVNRGGTKAAGYELAGDFDVTPRVRAFANYSYQSLADDEGFQLTAVSAAKHKANAGLRYRDGRWLSQLWVNWIDRTIWSVGGGAVEHVPAYSTVNGFLGYAFGGGLDGLEASVSASNIGDQARRSIPARAGGVPLRSRVFGTLSYRFL